MVLWILFAVLASAVVWAVTRPLLAQPSAAGPAPADDSEIAVYRDQLAEIDAERAQGLLGGAEAEGARVELVRRLLRHAEERELSSAAPGPAATAARQWVVYGAALLPVLGIFLYLAVGSPHLPSRPYAARLDTPLDKATPDDLVARVEAHLREHPEDGRGWDVLAPVYMRMGNFPQANDAFERAMRLQGESPKRLMGYARSNVMMQNGVVTEPARKAYQKLLALEPQSVEAQTWLAIAREQDGDLKGAEAEYRRLLPGAEEPWKGLLTARLRSVAEQLGEKPPPAEAAPADNPAAAISSMDPAEREKFIGKMVDGLAARLKENGNDLDGWIRLVRSYVVLGRKSDAAAALADARGQFAGDAKSLAQLNDLAQTLGLGS